MTHLTIRSPCTLRCSLASPAKVTLLNSTIEWSVKSGIIDARAVIQREKIVQRFFFFSSDEPSGPYWQLVGWLPGRLTSSMRVITSDNKVLHEISLDLELFLQGTVCERRRNLYYRSPGPSCSLRLQFSRLRLLGGWRINLTRLMGSTTYFGPLTRSEFSFFDNRLSTEKYRTLHSTLWDTVAKRYVRRFYTA